MWIARAPEPASPWVFLLWKQTAPASLFVCFCQPCWLWLLFASRAAGNQQPLRLAEGELSKAVQRKVIIDLQSAQLHTDTAREAKELHGSFAPGLWAAEPEVELTKVYGSEVLAQHQVPNCAQPFSVSLKWSNTQPGAVFFVLSQSIQAYAWVWLSMRQTWEVRMYFSTLPWSGGQVWARSLFTNQSMRRSKIEVSEVLCNIKKWIPKTGVTRASSTVARLLHWSCKGWPMKLPYKSHCNSGRAKSIKLKFDIFFQSFAQDEVFKLHSKVWGCTKDMVKSCASKVEWRSPCKETWSAIYMVFVSLVWVSSSSYFPIQWKTDFRKNKQDYCCLHASDGETTRFWRHTISAPQKFEHE